MPESPKLTKPRHKTPNLLIRGVEDMWPVTVDEHARLSFALRVTIAGDMLSRLKHMDFLPSLAEKVRQSRSGKTSSSDCNPRFFS